MYVYFIKSGKKGAIKIGKSNHHEDWMGMKWFINRDTGRQSDLYIK